MSDVPARAQTELGIQSALGAIQSGNYQNATIYLLQAVTGLLEHVLCSGTFPDARARQETIAAALPCPNCSSAGVLAQTETGTQTLTVTVAEDCPTCHGSGRVGAAAYAQFVAQFLAAVPISITTQQGPAQQFVAIPNDPTQTHTPS